MHFPLRVFVTAKISGRYRNLWEIELSGYHSGSGGARRIKAVQYCLLYGIIFQTSANHIPIQAELLSAHNKPEEFWTPRRQPGPVFPYIAACLNLRTSFDPSYYATNGAFYCSTSPTDAFLKRGDADVIVFDISEPLHVRYCFLVELGDSYWAPVPVADFLFQFDPEDYTEQERQDASLLIQKFVGFNSVTRECITETWTAHPRVVNSGGIESLPAPCRKISSLRALAMETLIQTFLTESESGVDMAWITEAELLPDFLPRLRLRIFAKAIDLEPSLETCRLLTKLLEGESVLTLGGLRKFGIEHLLTIISNLQGHGKACVLDLSNNPAITEEGLRSILEVTRDLKTLYLMDNPGISVQSVLTVLREGQFNVGSLYHTDLFKMAFAQDGSIQRRIDTLKFPTGAFTKSPVIEMLWFSAPAMDFWQARTVEDGPIDFGELRTFDCGFGKFPLDDVLLTPTRVVTGMYQFARHSLMDSGPRYSGVHYGEVASYSFTSAVSTVESKGIQVGPIPLKLFFQTHLLQETHLSRRRSSQPGDWSIVVIHETAGLYRYSSGLREKWTYAFVTPEDGQDPESSQVNFVVKDLKGFLAQVAEDDEAQEVIDFWDRVCAVNKSIKPCDERDVHGLLRIFFPPTGARRMQRSRY